MVLTNGKQTPLRSEGDSHNYDGVNYFHLCVNPQTNKWYEQPSSGVDWHNHMVFTIEGVEVLEITFGEEYGIYNDLCLPCMVNVLHYKNPLNNITLRVISKPITIAFLVPIYFSMSSQFSSAPLKLHKF